MEDETLLARLRQGISSEVTTGDVHQLKLATSGRHALLKISDGGNASFMTIASGPEWDSAPVFGPPLIPRLRGTKSEVGLSDPNSALVGLGRRKYIACEITDEDQLPPCDTSLYENAPMSFRSCRSLYCFVITAASDDVASPLTRSAEQIVDRGFFPQFPQTVHVVAAGERGGAIVCWVTQNWDLVAGDRSTETVPGDSVTEKRRDTLKCRSLSVDDDGQLALGFPFQIGDDGTLDPFHNSVGQVNLAPFDDARVLLCYGVISEHRCTVLNVNTTSHVISLGTRPNGLPVAYTVGRQRGRLSAKPCVISRLEEHSAVACCECTTLWIWREIVCTGLNVSKTGELREAGFNAWHAAALEPFVSVEPLEAVYLRNGQALLCYSQGQKRVSCEQLQVSRTKYWWDHLTSTNKAVIAGIDGTRASFLSAAAQAAGRGLLVCYRNKGTHGAPSSAECRQLQVQ